MIYDFTGIGELLIDFTPIKNIREETPVYVQQLGGAPANVASILSMLGWNTAFIGKVGNDHFGRFCEKKLSDIGVDVSNLIISNEHNTTLAFVHLNKDGNRDFTFYRKGTADTSLYKEEILPSALANTKFLHFGSISLTQNPARDATMYAVKQAKTEGAIISYDPNLRPSLWESMDMARSTIISMLKYVDLLKISDEESEFLFGDKDCEKMSKLISKEYSIPFVFITRGNRGSVAYVNNRFYQSYAYDVKTVNTTGAGDSALAGIIHNILKLQKSILSLENDEIKYMLDFANALGSLVTTKNEIAFDIPLIDKIEQCMREIPRLVIQ